MARPEVVVGWLLGADLRDPELLAAYELARERVRELLAEALPEFEWKSPYAERRVHLPRGGLDPVGLLEMGVDEKLHRRWDFAIVIVPNELIPRHRPYALGLSSRALEVAVLSTSRLSTGERLVEEITALALHFLGHLFGLEHAGAGPMRPVLEPGDLVPEPYRPGEIAQIRAYLKRVVITRLEEESERWNAVSFYLETLRQDPGSVFRQVLEHAPWRLPLYLGRFTAAAAVSTVYLVITSDAWALAASLPPAGIVGFTLVALLFSTFFLFHGQDLGRLGHERTWREQLARTRIVLFLTLGLGMLSLWALVFALTLVAGAAFPRSLLVQWAGRDAVLPFAGFSAALGVVAAAMGGNLEEEAEIKAELFIDEED